MILTEIVREKKIKNLIVYLIVCFFEDNTIFLIGILVSRKT